MSKQPEDAIYAAQYLFHLRDQPQSTLGVPRHEVTDLLVQALAVQVELKAGNVMQHIREIIIFSRELLTSEVSSVDTTRLIILIHEVVIPNIRRNYQDHPLDELIDVLRVASKHRPDLLGFRMHLAGFLASRYHRTYVNNDYEEAVSIWDEIVLHASGDTEGEYTAIIQGLTAGLASGLAMMRFSISGCGSPEYLEEVLYRSRTHLSLTPYKKRHPHAGFNMEDTAKLRFQYFGSIEESKSHLAIRRYVSQRCRKKVRLATRWMHFSFGSAMLTTRRTSTKLLNRPDPYLFQI